MGESFKDDKSLTMTVLMTPDLVNFSGNVHGGQMLRLLDQVAYACASRFAACYTVTLSVDQVMFRQAIHVGELVTFLASVNHVGKTSMEVGIKVVSEDVQKKTCRHVMSCFFTMVAVDEQRKPKLLPPLKIENETERRRNEEARLRKAIRQEYEARMKAVSLAE